MSDENVLVCINLHILCSFTHNVNIDQEFDKIHKEDQIMA